MVEYLVKNVWFSSINVLLLGLPGLGLFKIAEIYLGDSDLLVAVFALPGLACLVLNKLIVDYQVDPDVGYWQGWKLGINDVKTFLLFSIGKL